MVGDLNAQCISVAVDSTNCQLACVSGQFSGEYVYTEGGDSWRSVNRVPDHRSLNVKIFISDVFIRYTGLECADF